MLFSCVIDGIRNRYIDMSHQAVDSRFFPTSIGLRSQALKLKFVTLETKGHFLKPDFPIKQVMKIFESRFNTELPDPIFHQDYIGETLSIIYSPFYVDKKIYDAILNHPINEDLPEDFDVSHFAGGVPDWKIDFLSTLCPDCGWNLEGERNSLVLVCKNCESLWRPDKKGLNKLNFAQIPMKGDDIVYFPFWRIKADISCIQLDTYADLIKVANLPKVVQEGWDQIDFHFWIMAFKVRPQKFLRIATNMNLSQPREELVPELPKKDLPVTLSLTEAVNSLKLILANFVMPKKAVFPLLKDIAITPKSCLLVYVPFKEKHHEFVHPSYPISISKNHLALAGNL